MTLDALSEGTARLVVTAGGAEVDALRVRVKEATAVRLEDERGVSGTVSVNRATDVTLVAKMTAGSEEVIARTPYTWSRDGSALEAPDPASNGDRITLRPAEKGSSTVRVQWRELSATIVVKVE